MSNLTAQQIYEQTRGSHKKQIGTYLGKEPEKESQDLPEPEQSPELNRYLNGDILNA